VVEKDKNKPRTPMPMTSIDDTFRALSTIQKFAHTHQPTHCDKLDRQCILASSNEGDAYELRISLKATIFNLPPFELSLKNGENTPAQLFLTAEKASAVLAEYAQNLPDAAAMRRNYFNWYVSIKNGH
jgi:hypothetical protein